MKIELIKKDEEYLKGCGKIFSFEEKDKRIGTIKIKCGEWTEMPVVEQWIKLELCSICKSNRKVFLQTTKECAEDELEFLQHKINPKQCGCDRCPSCRIMQGDREKELQEVIKYCEEKLE